MKNKALLIIGIIIVILLTIIIIYKPTDKNFLTEISYEQYQEKVQNKENFILYIKQTNCSHCMEFSPRFERILKQYKVTAYFINLTNIDKNNALLLEDELSFKGTPVVMFFEEGNELGSFSRISGAKSNDFVIKKLKDRGYIK